MYEIHKAKMKKKKKQFKLTQPYLNLLEKPRIFFRFSGKYMILCIWQVFLSKEKEKKLRCTNPA